MPKKIALRTRSASISTEAVPTNAKVCEGCGSPNSFKRVKCDKCGALLPDGKFERSRRMREQSLRRERQLAFTSTLFKDKPIPIEESDDSSDADGGAGSQGGVKKAAALSAKNKDKAARVPARKRAS